MQDTTNITVSKSAVQLNIDPVDENTLNRATMTDGTGTTTFSYKPVTTGGTLGATRPATVDGPLANDTITYQYDELGRITNRAINSVGEGFVFDDLGRMTNHTSVLGAFAYSYVNATRRLSLVMYPNSQFTGFLYFNNTGDQRLSEMLNANLSTGATYSDFQYTYDPLGQITKWTQQKDSSTPDVMALDYDPEEQLLNAAVTPSGGSLAKTFSYAYDTAGNRTAEQIETTGAGASFLTSGSAYNNVNQLTNRALGPVMFRGTVNEPATVTVNGQTATMKQDPNSGSNGKIFTSTLSLPAGNNTVSVVAHDLGEPPAAPQGGNVTTKNYNVTVVGGQDKTFKYDSSGNLTNSVAGTTTNDYQWDAENRLVKITQSSPGNPTLESDFTYDGFSRWVKIVEKNNGAGTKTNRFVWSGKQLLQAREGDDLSAPTGHVFFKTFQREGVSVGGYGWGSDWSSVETYPSYFYIRDHLGSIREMVDSSGTIRARYDYDPYGRRTKVSGDLEADFGFTGYYVHQPSGLQLALYRAYDTDTGRWINRDPIAENGGLNLYDYVGNGPLNSIDPSGKELVGAILGGIFGGIVGGVTANPGHWSWKGAAGGFVGGIVGGLTFNPELGYLAGSLISGAASGAANGLTQQTLNDLDPSPCSHFNLKGLGAPFLGGLVGGLIMGGPVSGLNSWLGESASSELGGAADDLWGATTSIIGDDAVGYTDFFKNL